MVPLGMLAGVATGAIEFTEKFLIANVLDGMGVTLSQIFPVVCILAFGPTLTVAIPAVFAARALMVVVAFSVIVPAERPSLFMFDRECLQDFRVWGVVECDIRCQSADDVD